MTMTDMLEALTIGVLFGIALHKGGLTQYATITDVYRFVDLTVLSFMLSAICVAAPSIQAAVDLGLSLAPPLPETRLAANLVGGIVFGAGMALAGFCPGTVVAEIGEGRLDALFAGLGGLALGAVLFGWIHPLLMPTLGRIGAIGHVSLASLLGASPWLVLVCVLEICVLVLVVIRRRRHDPPGP